MLEIYTHIPAVAMSYYINEYVNTGLMLQLDVSRIVASRDLRKYKDDIVTLVRMYSPLSGKTVKINSGVVKLPDKYEFFTTEEVASAAFLTTAMQNALPVELKVLAELRPNNFITVLSIREIMALKTAGLIQWKSEMQREQVTDGMVNGKLISHIRFDPERSKEIGESIAAKTFYPNALRWHVIASDCVCGFEDDGKTFILRSGYFAEIDGQHRNKAIEYAITANPSVELNFPIIVSIGNVKTAQFIINQDEKRAPISKERVASYSNTFGRAVVDMIIAMDELNEDANFMSNPVEDIDSIKSLLISLINEYYTSKTPSNIAVKRTARWITDFVNYEYDCRYDYVHKTKTEPEISFKGEYIKVYISISSFWADKVYGDSFKFEDVQPALHRVFNNIYKYPRPADVLANKRVMRSHVCLNKSGSDV